MPEEEFRSLPLAEMAGVAWRMPGHVACNSLLMMLQLLHILWFSMLVKILIKILVGRKPHDAGQEDYEGQSSDNDE